MRKFMICLLLFVGIAAAAGAQEIRLNATCAKKITTTGDIVITGNLVVSNNVTIECRTLIIEAAVTTIQVNGTVKINCTSVIEIRAAPAATGPIMLIGNGASSKLTLTIPKVAAFPTTRAFATNGNIELNLTQQ